MRFVLVLLIFTVLLSLMINSQSNADSGSRYDQLFRMHQLGPLNAPESLPSQREYFCYARSAPNHPLSLTVNVNGRQVVQMESNSLRLSSLIADSVVNLSPTQLPIFNGTLLGGRSTPKNLMDSLNQRSFDSIFLGMSLHGPSHRSMLAILRLKQEQDVEAACAMTETLEYLCIEKADEV